MWSGHDRDWNGLSHCPIPQTFLFRRFDRPSSEPLKVAFYQSHVPLAKVSQIVSEASLGSFRYPGTGRQA